MDPGMILLMVFIFLLFCGGGGSHSCGPRGPGEGPPE